MLTLLGMFLKGQLLSHLIVNPIITIWYRGSHTGELSDAVMYISSVGCCVTCIWQVAELWTFYIIDRSLWITPLFDIRRKYVSHGQDKPQLNKPHPLKQPTISWYQFTLLLAMLTSIVNSKKRNIPTKSTNSNYDYNLVPRSRKFGHDPPYNKYDLGKVSNPKC